MIQKIDIPAPVSDSASFEKATAVVLMEMTCSVKDGEFIPNYELVSNMTGTPAKTLRGWWQNRESITKAVAKSYDMLDKIASSQLKLLRMKAIEELYSRGMESMSNRDAMSLIELTTKLSRLLDDKSTSNLAFKLLGIDGHV